MRVLLLRPDSGVFIAFPPLGLLSLAAYLRQYGQHEVHIFDGLERSSSDKEILAAVQGYQPDLVGISSLTFDSIEAHHTARIIKARVPRVKVVIGGPYASSEPFEAIRDEAIDFAVVGEGERPLLNLLNSLEEGQEAPEIPGIMQRRNGTIGFPGRDAPIPDLNSLPMPAWDLVDLERYFYNRRRPSQMNLHSKSRRCAPIQTGRGCPFHCTFCHNIFGKQLRLRSIESVLQEISYLKNERGVEEIEIVDDIFNLDQERALDMAQKIIEANFHLGFSLSNGLRPDCMSKELVDKLVEMGAFRICYGVDSGSPLTQGKIKRNLNLDKAREIVNYTADRGISVGIDFIIGFPDETEEEARKSLELAYQVRTSTASFFILNPFPGTEIYEEAVQAGKITGRYAPKHFYALGVNLSAMSDRTIRKLLNAAYRRYYLHPGRLLRFLRTTPVRQRFFLRSFMLLNLFLRRFRAQERDGQNGYGRGRWKRSRFS